MKSSQTRKRQPAHDSSRHHPPAKRSKPTTEPRRAANFPPAFWDHLSRVWLTPRALRELDRRNSTLPPTSHTAPIPTDLFRFARQGGPDIHHLRGYPEPHRIGSTMASQGGPTTTGGALKRTSAYDPGFAQHLIDHDIYPPRYLFPDGRPAPEPKNIARIRQDLLAPRSSISLSMFSESEFSEFQQKSMSVSEGTMMATAIPTIAGNANIPNVGHLRFTKLATITEGTIVQITPDFFDGACSDIINKAVRRALQQVIIPTKHTKVPVAPNLFLEAKGLQGGLNVALNQACIDGAYGARAMHSLQNYGETEPDYDGHAYTFSSTFCHGILRLFAHHIQAPAEAEAPPEYYMTNIGAWIMTDDVDVFRQGVTSFRNARDLAKQYRDRFIQAANARASPTAAIAEDVAERGEDGLPAADELVDHMDGVISQDVHNVQMANASDDKSQDGGEVLAVSHCLDTKEEDSQDHGQQTASPGFDNPSMISTSSLTLILVGHPILSKRPKHDLSPTSKFAEFHPSKSRTPPSTARRATK